MASRRLRAPERYDLGATLRATEMKAAGGGLAGPDEAWRASRTPDGPGTVAVRRVGSVLEVEAWGPGSDWLLHGAPALLGLGDDPEVFEPGPGLVRELHRRNQGLRLGRSQRPFEAALGAVLGQRVTSRQARAGYDRLASTYGDPAPGPRPLLLPPDPGTLAQLRYEDLHGLGIERSRAAIVIEVARRAKRLDGIVDMRRAEAWERLLAIRGIGPWTAGFVMGIAWGDTDAVPVGDYHLPNTVSWALAGEPRGDDERMLELLAPFSGQRRRVLLLLARSGRTAPKYGPRSPIVDIARI